MYDTILVPTDGSDHSARAAEHAGYLAELFDATVHVVNVVDVDEAGGLFDVGGLDEEFLDRLEAKGEEAIAAVTGDMEDVTTAVVRGEPSEAILEYVEDHGVDLVSMGTHGRRGLNRYIAGSVTERVVRLAEVPVLTVRAVERSELADYEEVLIPTDGSDASLVAAEHGLAVAERTGARVHAVNVVDFAEIAAGSNYTIPTQLLDQLQELGENAVEDVADMARERDIDVVTQVGEGTPASEILRYADDHDVDLLVMGTHGRTGLDRYLMGSTTERVIRRAAVPVLAVHPGEEAE